MSYGHGDCDSELSCVIYDLRTRVATIKLATDWECQVTDRNLKEVALHEVLHLALARLMELAETRYDLTRDALSESEHDVIDRMIFARFGDFYDTSNARTEEFVEEK